MDFVWISYRFRMVFPFSDYSESNFLTASEAILPFSDCSESNFLTASEAILLFLDYSESNFFGRV